MFTALMQESAVPASYVCPSQEDTPPVLCILLIVFIARNGDCLFIIISSVKLFPSSTQV